MGSLSPVRNAAHAEAVVATTPSAAPALEPLSQADIRRGLRISIVEGAVATFHISITGVIGGSVFLTGFALLLGANSFQLGLLGALPFIGQAFQFLGAYLEERVGDRRSLVLYAALSGRLLWALLLLLPFLSFLGGAQLAIFFAALACSYALNGIAGNAWLSWMSDLVPPRQRGSYFGMRNTVAAVAAMASTFLAGLALDSFRAQGLDALGYALIFGVAVLAALGSAALIARQPEPPLKPHRNIDLRAMLGAPLADQRFRAYVLAATGWALVTGVAAPFFNAYGLRTLGLDFSTLALTAIVTSAVSLIFTPLTGRLQDKLGDKLVLTVCVFGTVLLPWGWVFSTPDNILPLWLTSIFSGVFWPGVNQGIQNLLMDRAPAAHRGAAMAAYSAVTGLGTLAAGLLGGVLSTVLASAQLGVGPLVVQGLAVLFVLSSLGRLAMVGVFWKHL